MCVLLMISCAFAGFAANAKGMDLATEDANNWRVKDVFILPSGIQGWHFWKPTVTAVGLETPFNPVSTGEYTAYIHNTWAGDLTGMRIEAEFMIGSDAAPVFEARLPDTSVQVRLHFQTTAGNWEPTDLWWSVACVILTSYNLDDTTTTCGLNTMLSLKVSLDPSLWSNHDGILGSNDLSAFKEAIADVQEIGFSFGRSESYASGVALSSGDATFILTSYEILEA